MIPRCQILFTALGFSVATLATEAFAPQYRTANQRSCVTTTTVTELMSSYESVDSSDEKRRSFMLAGVSAALASLGWAESAGAEQTSEYRQGIEVTAFNGLIFNYRGGEFGGLDASSLQEPSVSYAEFNQRLKAGEVEFVEFLAPDGDAAYVTFKAKEGESKSAPIRIGEGYPLEQHDGYSSPMFCVRAVKNAGVPYKFTVAALAKFNK